MFSKSKTEPASEKTNSFEVNKKKELSEKLEKLAQEAEVEFLQKADEYFENYQKELKDRLEGYSFKCIRFGDFLTVFISQTANYLGSPAKVSESLNLGKTKSIEFFPGAIPDRTATVRYVPQLELIHKDEGFSYKVYGFPDTYRDSRDRLIIESKDDSFGNDHFGTSCYQNLGVIISRTTPNFPKPSIDDTIVFNGIGRSLKIPAGKGEEIRNLILEEIARGWERPDLFSV